MSDTSTKLGLMLPIQSDPFSTNDVRANFEKIDASPGTYICTSTTRPSWDSAKAGRKIYETNTGLEWVWDGTAFRRTTGVGLLKNNAGQWAVVQTGAGSWGSTAYAIHTGLGSVGVPAGNRPIRIEAEFNGVESNPNNYVHVAIANGSTNNSGILWEYRTGTGPNVHYGPGGRLSVLYQDGLAPGYYTWSFQYRASSGSTATIGTVKMWAEEL